jgi:hypothetical protein
MANPGIDEAVEKDVCQHDGCTALGYAVYDFYGAEWRHYCGEHLAEHGFCVACLRNIFSLGDDGLCAGCRLAREMMGGEK